MLYVCRLGGSSLIVYKMLDLGCFLLGIIYVALQNKTANIELEMLLFLSKQWFGFNQETNLGHLFCHTQKKKKT